MSLAARAAAGRAPNAATAIDSACLAGITIASALPYVARLGFYSDDWALLAGFEAARDQAKLASVVGANFVARPVQGVYLAGLFQLFGRDPLGYHLVNTAVIAASVVLLYQLLLRLTAGRPGALATAILFVALPQLSTVRVWYAASQIPLSMMLMLISMHCQLSFRDSGKRRWLAGAGIAALLSIAAYEICAPLIAGFATWLALAGWRSSEHHVTIRQSPTGVSAMAVVGLVIVAAVYKLLFSGRTRPPGDFDRYAAGLRQLVRTDYDWRTDSSLNVFAAARAELWAPIRGWWTGAEALFAGRSGLLTAALVFAIGGVAWWRLAGCPEKLHGLGVAMRLFLLGGAVFLLGHAAFLIVPSITFSSTGVGNRTHVAAALGVAMMFASCLIFASAAVPAAGRRTGLATLVSAATVAALIRLWTIEAYWAEAPALQRRVLAAARVDLQHVAPNSTVILDRVCPNHGPAVVFETNWDVSGALTLELGKPIIGDVVSRRMAVSRAGLETSMYKERSFYPYGRSLYIYDPVIHRLVVVADETAAVRYFESRRPVKCPIGFVARGVEV